MSPVLFAVIWGRRLVVERGSERHERRKAAASAASSKREGEMWMGEVAP